MEYEIKDGILNIKEFNTEEIDYNEKCFLCEWIRSDQIPKHLSPHQLCLPHVIETLRDVLQQRQEYRRLIKEYQERGAHGGGN